VAVLKQRGGDELELSKFLVKAKISGYASGGEGKEIILEDGGKEFFYSENDLEDSDIYYGFNPFIGQEIVKRKGQVIWVMNYSGETSLQGKEAIALYSFLKLALQDPDPVLPLRGPSDFKKDNFAYSNTVKGSIDSFSGEEIVQVDGRTVYKLLYHGGTIKRG